MSILNSRAEVLDLIKKREFFEALLVDSPEQYDTKPREFRTQFGRHYDSNWAEEDNFTGVDIFSTPLKQIGHGESFGTWLNISRQFNSPECPYRVTACEYVPWGVEVDMDHVGDYATLGQAFDHAFNIHEHGHIEIHVPFNGGGDRSVTIKPEIFVPELANLSHEALVINEALTALPQRRLEFELAQKQEMIFQNEVYRLAWQSPVSHEDAKSILNDLSARIERIDRHNYFDAMHAAASSINSRLFAGKGKLLSYQCQDLASLECQGIDVIGTVFVAVEQESGGHAFYSADCGIHENAADLRAAVTAKLIEQHAGIHELDNLYWVDGIGELVEIDLENLVVSEIEPVVIDVELELIEHTGWQGSVEWEIDQAVFNASKPYRYAMQERIESGLRADQSALPEPSL